MTRKTELAAQAQAHHAQIKAAADLAGVLYHALTRALDQAFQQMTRQIKQESALTMQRIEADLEDIRRSTNTTIQASLKSAGFAAADWSLSGWQTYTPPTAGGPPTMLRIGTLRLTPPATKLPSLPAFVPLVGSRHILISFEEAQSRLGAEILQTLAWRIAALSPPESYRFVLFDPLDQGTNLASLLKLPETLRGIKIYCRDDEVEQALQQVAADIEEIIQRRLLNTYRDIQAYNRANPDVAIPYRFLVMIGFPKGFSPKAAELLSTIARTGPRTGCYVLGGVLKGEQPPRGFDFRAFMNLASYLSLKNSRQIQWHDPDFPQATIQPDGAPPPGLIDRLAQVIQPLVVAASVTNIPFRRIAVRKSQWWHERSADGVALILGVDESGKDFRLVLGTNGAYHALIGGATGMGKTNLLHLLVLMLSTAYPPDELEFYLVDFKEGVEFQDYVTHALPHARAVVLEAEREFGLSVLQRLVLEMEQRSQAFKQAKVGSLQEYRQRTNQKMPRTILLMDEYVVLFSEDDRLSFQASEALAALVQRGRSFGIHVLLSAQRPASTFLSMSQIKSQMGLRMALKCRPEDSTLILGEGNERAARLVQAGEACVTADPDRIDATTLVRIARLDPDERALYLRGLQEFARLQQYRPRSPMIVFSRDAAARWTEAQQVTQRLAASHWRQPYPIQCWLGLPFRIAEDLVVRFERQQGANLLCLGLDDGLASRLLFSAVLGLSLAVKPQRCRFVLIGRIDPAQPVGQAFLTLQKTLAHPFDPVDRQAAVDMLASLISELETRQATLPSQAETTIFIIIAGLQRWQEARGANPYTPSVVGEQLMRLCQQGPEVGIHILLSCDRLSTLGAAVGGGGVHDLIAQFGHRVALQMSSDESINLLGSPYAAKLGSERAYYRNEQWPADVLDKFKPYAPLSPTELQTVIATLHDRWALT
ncbi:hypothetical protein EYB53_024735 [Candidatus Chloroploca sp. M-50]|uniref:FtsK domain-containing protein n=1 Tax=Candidatus Chloroploca mongolica TaxID=2528176 RepID=A0ABS4DHP8_9CHLR|nr:FtsK/SpoIIIE domain-containing protein [Candidatus Chloroploca mongolica]MBP1468938.1 hypothetical protein [Candidatus Chloroploca mongolica]